MHASLSIVVSVACSESKIFERNSRAEQLFGTKKEIVERRETFSCFSKEISERSRALALQKERNSGRERFAKEMDEKGIEVGAKGTIASLMCKELESIRKQQREHTGRGSAHSSFKSSPLTRLRAKTEVVSVFCDAAAASSSSLCSSSPARRQKRGAESARSAPLPRLSVRERNQESERRNHHPLRKCSSERRRLLRSWDEDFGDEDSDIEWKNSRRGTRVDKARASVVEVVDMRCMGASPAAHQQKKCHESHSIAGRMMRRLSFSRLYNSRGI